MQATLTPEQKEALDTISRAAIWALDGIMTEDERLDKALTTTFDWVRPTWSLLLNQRINAMSYQYRQSRERIAEWLDAIDESRVVSRVLDWERYLETVSALHDVLRDMTEFGTSVDVIERVVLLQHALVRSAPELFPNADKGAFEFPA